MPQAIFVRPRMDAYREASRQVMRILRSYTALVEPLSLDEAFLDVTAATASGTLAVEIAREVLDRIHRETELTASAGVSYNKLLAKLASDWRKPHGLFVIPPERGLAFLAPLPVGKLHGVGPATVKRLSAMGIETVSDLRALSRETLVAHFGKAGSWFYGVARGIDDRPVQPARQRKSVGTERTFSESLADRSIMLAILEEMTVQVAARLESLTLVGHTVSIKARFPDFTTVTRARTEGEIVGDLESIGPLLLELLDRAVPFGASVRLLGITVSGLAQSQTASRGAHQMSLLDGILNWR